MKKKALASLDLLVFIGLFLFASCGNRLLLDNEESIKNPEAPTINKIIPGDGKVYLEWTLPTDGSLIRASEYARQYRIYYSETAIDIATSKYVETGVHSGDRKITISGLTNWTEYNFAVMAINYGGVSDISASKAATPAPIDITTLDPPSYSPLILYTSLTSSPYWGSSDPSVTYKALGNWPTELTLSSDGVVSLAFSAGTKAIGNYQIEVTGNGSNTGVITVNIVVLLNPIKLGEVAGFSLDVDDRAVTALTADTYMAITNSAKLIPGTDYSLSLSSAPPGGALTITKEGRIIIPDTLALSNNGMTYTLRAEGKGAYLEFLEKSFVLTVAPKDINSLTGLTLGYAPQNVNANPPTEIPVSGSLSHGLRAGTDLTFDITARPQGSNKAAVTIDSGSGDITIKNTIIGTDGGGYTVTATGQGNYAGSKEESFFLTVNSVSIELLEGTNASAPPAGTAISKSYGDASFNLYAKTTTTGSFTGDLVSWSSGNAAVGVAQDPTDGHLASITANQPGSATITAYSNEGSGVAASIDIDVDEKSVQSGSVTLMYGPISSIVPGAATGNTSSPDYWRSFGRIRSSCGCGHI